MPRACCTVRCAANFSANRCGSPKSRREWSRRTSRSAASTGDEERAEKVYEGVTPLVAEDIAEVIGFVASRPPHVDLDLIVVRPRDQVSGASGSRFNRRVQT